MSVRTVSSVPVTSSLSATSSSSSPKKLPHPKNHAPSGQEKSISDRQVTLDPGRATMVAWSDQPIIHAFLELLIVEDGKLRERETLLDSSAFYLNNFHRLYQRMDCAIKGANNGNNPISSASRGQDPQLFIEMGQLLENISTVNLLFALKKVRVDQDKAPKTAEEFLEHFSNPSELSRIVLQDIPFPVIPTVLRTCPHVVSLSVTECEMVVVPSFEKTDFPSLKALNLSANDIAHFRTEPGALPLLEELDLSHNEFRQFGLTTLLPNLTRLDLHRNNLGKTEKFTKDIFPALTNLTLTHNILESLEIENALLEQLKYFNISDCGLRFTASSPVILESTTGWGGDVATQSNFDLDYPDITKKKEKFLFCTTDGKQGADHQPRKKKESGCTIQ